MSPSEIGGGGGAIVIVPRVYESFRGVARIRELFENVKQYWLPRIPQPVGTVVPGQRHKVYPASVLRLRLLYGLEHWEAACRAGPAGPRLYHAGHGGE